MTAYWWVRVYNYNKTDTSKGELLDEFYLKGKGLERGEVKRQVSERYMGIKFAKPKKKNGVYAIVMDSNEFFYSRFYKVINTLCFLCHKPISGKAMYFPNLEDNNYFCSYECKDKFYRRLNHEGEFQSKELGGNGTIYGYIYCIHNRITDKYYIGQTRYMPFFRWQEHIKEGKKGDIKDLTFSVITEVQKISNHSKEQLKEYLNNLESWWIKKYIQEGKSVMNITLPRLTMDDFQDRFDSACKHLSLHKRLI